MTTPLPTKTIKPQQQLAEEESEEEEFMTHLGSPNWTFHFQVQCLLGWRRLKWAIPNSFCLFSLNLLCLYFGGVDWFDYSNCEDTICFKFLGEISLVCTNLTSTF